MRYRLLDTPNAAPKVEFVSSIFGWVFSRHVAVHTGGTCWRWEKSGIVVSAFYANLAGGAMWLAGRSE